jgi:hypothetical protein
MPTKGRVQVAPGQVIQSSQWGNPLWDQSVQCFASAADRATQYPAPHEGSLSFLADTSRLDKFTGGAWAAVAPTVVSNTVAIASPILYCRTVAVTTDGGGGAVVPISPPFPGAFVAASVTDATTAIGGVVYKVDFQNSSTSGLKILAYGSGGGVIPGYSLVVSVIIPGN